MCIEGILKQDQIKKIKRKDGTITEKRIIYVESGNSVFPIKITIDDHNLKIGKIGETIKIDVEIYSYCFENGLRKRAFVNYFVRSK